MTSLLLFGLFIGMRHAMEADHVAAIASLVSKQQSLGYTLRQGACWGLGHTITLFLFGTVVIFMNTVMSEQLVKYLETAVGVMLVVLGLDVLRRLLRDKIHVHGHRHENGIYHLHLHAHAGDKASDHAASRHDHEHVQGFPLRALMVGMMHGMAGSAAVILLALETVSSPLQGILYILVFGIGSTFGMAILSIVISMPLRVSANRLVRFNVALQLLIGFLTISIGVMAIAQNSGLLSV